MNRNEWLARRIETSKLIMKRWKEREEKWRDELLKNMDEEVEFTPSGVEFVSKKFCPTSEDAIGWFEYRFGQTCVMDNITDLKDGWEIEWSQLRQYTTVDIPEAKRTVYSTSPEIDLDILKKIDPNLYSRITKTERVTSLDEGLLERAVEESPEILPVLSKAMKAGNPRVRLTIKKVEDE